MTFSLSNHLTADYAGQTLRDDVQKGLHKTPKALPSKWFYDSVGSDLFDQITRLPEYYLTQAESQILHAQSAAIVAASCADTLVELGSGTSEKTRILLSAMTNTGSLQRFIPFDVDASILIRSGEILGKEYPDLKIDAVCGDFEKHLAAIPGGGRRICAFLGSTIGNLTQHQRAEFLNNLANTLEPGDSLLLGVDLLKNVDRLLPAYNDNAGITARFNQNILTVINRELNANFIAENFAHVARWNADAERMEMHLRATTSHQVTVKNLDFSVDFAADEEMLTEVSCKFRPEVVDHELNAAGLSPIHWWIDSAGDFGLTLARK